MLLPCRRSRGSVEHGTSIPALHFSPVVLSVEYVLTRSSLQIGLADPSICRTSPGQHYRHLHLRSRPRGSMTMPVCQNSLTRWISMLTLLRASQHHLNRRRRSSGDIMVPLGLPADTLPAATRLSRPCSLSVRPPSLFIPSKRNPADPSNRSESLPSEGPHIRQEYITVISFLAVASAQHCARLSTATVDSLFCVVDLCRYLCLLWIAHVSLLFLELSFGLV